MGIRRALILFCCTLTIAAAPGKSLWGQTHDKLSPSLRHRAEQASSATDGSLAVIVRSSQGDVDAIAARRHLAIAKRIEGGAVFHASAADLAALGADASVDSPCCRNGHKDQVSHARIRRVKSCSTERGTTWIQRTSANPPTEAPVPFIAVNLCGRDFR